MYFLQFEGEGENPHSPAIINNCEDWILVVIKEQEGVGRDGSEGFLSQATLAWSQLSGPFLWEHILVPVANLDYQENKKLNEAYKWYYNVHQH